MKSHLKVKVVSMAAEMTYIRRQELKWKEKARFARRRQMEGKEAVSAYAENNFWSLREHRYELKGQARHTHLAYGALKGVRYSEMEPICYGVFKGFGSVEPNWEYIEQMVTKFSRDETKPQEIMQRFAEWLADAKAWYEGNKERIPAMKEWLEAERQAKARDPQYQAIKSAIAIAHRKYNGIVD